MLLTPDGSIQAFASAPLNNVVSTPSTGASSTTALLSVSLNLATDMVTFSENGTSLGTFAAGDLSSIADVNITDLHTSTGSFENLDLTYAAAVPEPSTVWALVLVGGAFVSMIVRFRRRMG